MNSLLLHRLIKAVPFAMAAFSVLLMVHGVHVHNGGDPGGPGEPNIHFVHNGGDPGGPGEPN